MNEELPPISPHGSADDHEPGYHFREDSEVFILAIQEADSIEALKLA